MKTDQNKCIAIICNPKSGKGKPLKWLQYFIRYLKNQKIDFTCFIATLPESLNGFTDLVIMGGDGTLNYTLNHFKSISIPVSVIPCGTGNDFGYALLGKRTKESYFRNAVYASPLPVDAGVCNGRYFVNGVGIGFDGWVVRNLMAKKLLKGKAAYYFTVIGLLLFYKETRTKISIGDWYVENDLFMCCAANSPTVGGGFKIAPLALMNDSLFDVLIVNKITLMQRLRNLPIIEKGKHLENPANFIHFSRGNKLIVESDDTLQAHLDGEWLESNRFEVNLLPNYLKIRYGSNESDIG